MVKQPAVAKTLLNVYELVTTMVTKENHEGEISFSEIS